MSCVPITGMQAIPPRINYAYPRATDTNGLRVEAWVFSLWANNERTVQGTVAFFGGEGLA